MASLKGGKWLKLGWPLVQIGSLTSLFPIAYGFSKFVSGVLGARTSPTLMLAGGLMATAAVNLLFGAGNTLPWFLTFWAINGILQARFFPLSLIPLEAFEDPCHLPNTRPCPVLHCHAHLPVEC